MTAKKKKTAKRPRTARKMRERVYLPSIEQWGHITAIEKDGKTVHVECDNGFRWFGAPESVVTEDDTKVAPDPEPAQEVAPGIDVPSPVS